MTTLYCYVSIDKFIEIIESDVFENDKTEFFFNKNTPPFDIDIIIEFEFGKILKKYIISVYFQNDSILDRKVSELLPKLENIKIYNNGKEY